jgi:hypothetical protein
MNKRGAEVWTYRVADLEAHRTLHDQLRLAQALNAQIQRSLIQGYIIVVLWTAFKGGETGVQLAMRRETGDTEIMVLLCRMNLRVRKVGTRCE